MKKILDRFAEGQAPMYGWTSNKEPSRKEMALIASGAFLGVIVVKFLGM